MRQAKAQCAGDGPFSCQARQRRHGAFGGLPSGGVAECASKNETVH